jgi:hypothetical protein
MIETPDANLSIGIRRLNGILFSFPFEWEGTGGVGGSIHAVEMDTESNRIVDRYIDRDHLGNSYELRLQ